MGFLPKVLGAEVALTGDQLKPILRVMLSAALKRRAALSEYGIADWQERKADRIGVRLTTFQNWYYGNEASASGSAPGPLPNFENWIALCVEFPGLQDEVVGEVIGERGSAPDLSEQIAASEALTEALKAKQAPVVPLKRRA